MLLIPKGFGSNFVESSQKKGVCRMWGAGNKWQLFLEIQP